MIGTKSIAALLLLAVSAAMAHGTGLTEPTKLLAVDGGTAFWIGVFAAVAGSLLFKFWRGGERSNHYFRLSRGPSNWQGESHFLGSEEFHIAIGDNTGEAHELSPHLRHAIYIGCAFVVAWATLDARALETLREMPERMGKAGSEFCKDPEERKKTAVKSPDEPGCALIQRAFELGYAKSLGACAKKEEVQAAAMCHLRQLDEPWLHYSWRRLVGFATAVRHHSQPEQMATMRRDMEERADKIETLLGAQRHVLGGAPRSSHHIWTNLPDPGDVDQHFCLDRYRVLPHRPPAGPDDDLRNARVFEHVLAQLMFESRYEPAAGFCREYSIHWNAAPDVCSTLVAEPRAVLRDSGALDDVELTLQRYHAIMEVEALEAHLSHGAKKEKMKLVPPARFISFSCYVEELRPDVWRSTEKMLLNGYDFTAEELRAPALGADGSGMSVDRYAHVAALVVQGFHFGGLMSEAGIDAQPPAEAAAQAFAGKDFYFTRLSSLANLDVFLDHEWIADRKDLLDVYPYHTHLRNYVQTFRRQYRAHRGRL